MGQVQKIVPGSVLVTGATGSMGAAAVRSLARKGIPVIMACRNMGRADAVVESVLKEVPDARLLPVQVDMESLSSVRELVSSLRGTSDGGASSVGLSLGGLFNNAGIINRDYGVTIDGFERTMQVNYLAPCLLTRLLLGDFAPGAHIVNMVSVTTKVASLDAGWPSWAPERFSQLGTYGSSKLALLYFTVALARRRPDLYVNMSDPGVVNSKMISMGRWFDPLADIFFRPFISSPEKGVQPAMRALETDLHLKYFVGRGWKEVPSRFLDNPLVDELWNQSEKLLGL